MAVGRLMSHTASKNAAQISHDKSEDSIEKTACQTDRSRSGPRAAAVIISSRVVLTCIIVALDLGILFMCFVISHFTEKDIAWIQQDRINRGLSEFYVPCNFVSLSVDEDLETFDSSKHDVKLYRDENGTRICAFRNITSVVEKATERIARQRVAEGLFQPTYLSCGNFLNKPHSGEYVAYFSKLSSKPSTTERTGTRQEILQWAHVPSSSFIGKGISYTNGRVSVDIGQFYFVYASVAFNKSAAVRSGNVGFRSGVFIVDIVTAAVDDGVEYTTRDLTFAETVSECPDGVGTAFVGSQVYLDNRDVLYVTVNDGERVLQGSHGNAFGIYAT